MGLSFYDINDVLGQVDSERSEGPELRLRWKVPYPNREVGQVNVLIVDFRFFFLDVILDPACIDDEQKTDGQIECNNHVSQSVASDLNVTKFWEHNLFCCTETNEKQ